jgi:hypothetical protein
VRHALAAIKPAIFLCRLRFLISPCLKVSLSAVGQEHFPRGLELGAGLIEGLRCAAGAFTRTRARIETAAPFPRLGIVRIAGTLGDRADMHVTIVDQPVFLAMNWRLAAGEGGHGP